MSDIIVILENQNLIVEGEFQKYQYQKIDLDKDNPSVFDPRKMFLNNLVANMMDVFLAEFRTR